MKIKEFIIEAFTAVVNYNKKKYRTTGTGLDAYLNQKKALWYCMMNAVDGEGEIEKPDAVKTDGPDKACDSVADSSR